MTINDVKHSVACRVTHLKQGNTFVKPPQPLNKNIFLNTLGYSAYLLSKYIIDLSGSTLAPISNEDFIAMCASGKRKRYSQAAVVLEKEGWSKRDAHIKYFVKSEKMDFGLKPDKAPRAIQPRSYVYQLALGKYIKPVEHKLYEAIANALFGGSPTVIKGYNVDQIGQIVKTKWNRFKKPVAIGWDATSFDQHVSVPALKFEHSIYQTIYNGDKNLRNLLKCQLENYGYGFTRDGYKFSYDVTGGRMSGDQNTALGNCILMCCLSYHFCEKYNIKNRELLNNGDDCVMIVEEEDISYFKSYFPSFCLKYGFQMVMEEPVSVLEQIEFCQHQPVLVNGSYRMVRKPSSAITKDLIINDISVTQDQYYSWCHAVSDGGVSLNSGVPVLQSFYSFLGSCPLPRKRIIKAQWKLDEGLSQQWGKDLHRKAQNISEESRLSFFLAFGIMPHRQLEMEQLFRDTDNTYNLSAEGPAGNSVTQTDPIDNLNSIYDTIYQHSFIHFYPIVIHAKQQL